MNTLGLYIHIPFCKSKCRYCDFCSFPHPKEDTVDAYLTALSHEIETESAKLTEKYGSAPVADTVFFGGGTPTLLTAEQFDRLTQTLFRCFRIDGNAEITAECNPATADRDYFRALRQMGINRLSVGAQSMNDDELKTLGRLHRSDDVLRTVSDARNAGFENLSVDVMFGIPGGTLESLSDTLDCLMRLSPEHISVYGLQIEDGTYFARHRNELVLPDEDTERQMYTRIRSLLADRGLHRYEISNYAKPGMESHHNLKYWRREDYLGLGLAAHSCLGDLRFSNTESLPDYLAGNRRDTCETVSDHDIVCEKIMLGMRLAQGVDFSVLSHEHGPHVLRYRDKLAQYEKNGLVSIRNDTVAFTEDGMYVSNALLAEVLDFSDETDT